MVRLPRDSYSCSLVQIWPQLISQSSPRTRQSRHHRTDGNRKCVGNLLIRHLLNLTQKKDLAEMHREFIDRTLQEFVARSRQQERLWRVVLNGRLRALYVFVGIERYGHGSFQSRARGQERVAQDAIDPC